MYKLSAVIITQNEERNIGRCIDSLTGVADEIVVVDSGSCDQTEQICKEKGAIFQHHNWAGFSGQKNYAETLASGDWVLSIDADEALSPALQAEVKELKQLTPQDQAFRLKRLTNFCGSWIRHCGWYPDAKIRIWPRGKAKWAGTIHETIEFVSAPRITTLKGDLLHYSYYSIDELAARQPKYYTLGAQEALAKGRRCSWAALAGKTAWTFLRDYVIRLGFLDGYAGYVVCKMNAHYTFMKYATLRELTKELRN